VNYPLIGLFVLVLGAVLVGIVLWLASGGAFRQKFDLYAAVMDESVAGLNLNAPVKYNGVDVGQVREIRLAPNNPARVNLLFALEGGTPVKEDTVAVLKTQGLTGIAYVELSGGAPESPQLRATGQNPYPVIPTKPSLSARLENVLTTVLAKLDSTSSSINAILSDENKAAFSSALADIAIVSRTIAARKQSLDAGIASAARAAEQAGPVLERIDRAAASVDKMGLEVARTSASAGKTVDSVGVDLTRFTSETLPELELLAGELSALSTSLRRLTDQTERNPAGFLFGRTAVPVGPGEAAKGAPQK
jgi:phospholipid/cholesterol/gamma-HCH transport system substrate-binding protein